MTQFETLIKEFRRPFPAEAVMAKIQATSNYDNKPSALIVFYIDARHVSERLNQLCPGQWSQKYRYITLGDQVGVECEITIVLLEEGTIHRSDIGTMQASLEQGGGLKAMNSDAFKRAAVHLGIGVSLYSQERNIWMPATASDGAKLLKIKGDKPTGLTDAAQEKMSAKYKHWLENEGIEKFGEPVEVS